jgi:hypothetical protein
MSKSGTGATLLAVATDGFDWTTFHRLFTERFFFRSRWLFEYVRMSAIIVAGKVRWRGFATEITIDALIIDVKLSGYVLRILICDICHRSSPLFGSIDRSSG